jgi:large subunit ribosomal protein L25
MAETLNVKERESGGKRNSRRLRRAGSVPAVLYGHGKPNKKLTVLADEMAAVVRHGGRVVDLAGAVKEKAFIRELQWDTYSTHVLHVDFTRVSEHERVTVKVSVDLRGQAAGIKAGGTVEHLVREVEINCEALEIPEKLTVNINDLQVGSQITAAEVPLPSGATLISDPDVVLVQCVETRDDDEEAPSAGAVEPELIGRKPGEDEAAEG